MTAYKKKTTKTRDDIDVLYFEKDRMRVITWKEDGFNYRLRISHDGLSEKDVLKWGEENVVKIE